VRRKEKKNNLLLTIVDLAGNITGLAQQANVRKGDTIKVLMFLLANLTKQK
jgi:hypothetical protein